MTPDRGAFRATISRSVRLFRAFLREQSDPEAFYTALADDSAAQLASMIDLDGRLLLDVGGGPGYFARAFAVRGARYIGVELDAPTDFVADSYAVHGSGLALPFRSGAVDIVYCSNVLEHVGHPQQLLAELARVARPGGHVVVSFTPWWSPWGGHETSPWHYLGGSYARRRYHRQHGHQPKNRYGESLFGYRVGEAVGWARSLPGGDLQFAIPRYHPRWAWWVTRVAAAREVATWNLLLVWRRR
ncbi:MAG: class I SAM-dependent methyltransferase [Jatrophihabitans sp.]